MLGVSVCLLLGAADGSWLRRVPDADRARANPLPDKVAAAEAGAHVYAAECARCHGERAEGKGNRPALKSERVAAATDGELAWLLKNGNSWKGMPSWSSMPDTRRWQVVAYLRSINTRAAPPEPPRGEQR
jgi:mono/diheme cytochrome c family protein